jgi:hypothetical protein
MVLSGWRLASAATTGRTLSIHGVGQGPSAEKSRYVHAEMDASLGQGDGGAGGRSSGLSALDGRTSSAYVQKNGLAVGDDNCISSAMRKHCTGERRDIRGRAMRGIGLVLADNLEALFAPILSAQRDRSFRRTPCFYPLEF